MGDRQATVRLDRIYLYSATQRFHMSWTPEHLRVGQVIRMYRAIGKAAPGMSEARENAKLGELRKLLGRRGLVIAYDSHVLSLKVFEARLDSKRLPVELFCGEGGKQAKKNAMKRLGLGTQADRPAAS